MPYCRKNIICHKEDGHEGPCFQEAILESQEPREFTWADLQALQTPIIARLTAEDLQTPANRAFQAGLIGSGPMFNPKLAAWVYRMESYRRELKATLRIYEGPEGGIAKPFLELAQENYQDMLRGLCRELGVPGFD